MGIFNMIWGRRYLVWVLASTLSVFSCNDEGTDQPAPSINLTGSNLVDGTYTANKGETVDLQVSVQSPAGFKVLRINYEGISLEPLEVSSNESGQTSFQYSFSSEAIEYEGQPFEITFIALDAFDQSGEAKISVEPEAPSITFPDTENEFIVSDTLMVAALQNFTLGVAVGAEGGFVRYTAELPNPGGGLSLYISERTELPPTQGNSFVDRIELAIPFEFTGQVLGFVFSVEDELGSKVEVTLPVKVGEAQLITYNSILQAPVGDTQGTRTSKTFLSSSDGSTYSFDEVLSSEEDISGQIDLGYFYDTGVGNATITSVNSYPLSIYNVISNPDWQNKNVTNMKMSSITQEEFDAITDANELIDLFENNLMSPFLQATQLEVGDFVSFKTESEKYGVFKVTRLIAGESASGEIEVEVKVIE